MALRPAAPLNDLVQLERSLLHVFVAGPGFGEGITLALPGGGWVTLDSCACSPGSFPLLTVLERWGEPGGTVRAAIFPTPTRTTAKAVSASYREIQLAEKVRSNPEQPPLDPGDRVPGAGAVGVVRRRV